MCLKRNKRHKSDKKFNMITNIIRNKSETKGMTKHISCHCKFTFNSATCKSNQKWNNKAYQCEYKNYRTCKKDYSWNPSI